MKLISDRQWWPFAVDANAEQSIEMTVKIKFLTQAARCVGRAFVQNNELECGAIGDNGRECLIVWRGKRRAETILMQSGELKHKRAFSSVEEGEAFNDAASVGLRWLNGGESDIDSDQ